MSVLSRVMVTVASATAVLALSCSAAPPASVTGSWSGTWQSSQANASPSSGTVSITATQNGTTVTGSGIVSPLSAGVLTNCTYVSGRWVGTLVATIGSVSFDGNVSGDSASGTYTTSFGDKGSFSVSRKSGG